MSACITLVIILAVVAVELDHDFVRVGPVARVDVTTIVLVMVIDLEHGVVAAGRVARVIVVLEIRLNVGTGLARVADGLVARVCLAQPALLRSGLDAGGVGFAGLADLGIPRPPALLLQDLDAVGRQAFQALPVRRALVVDPPAEPCRIVLCRVLPAVLLQKRLQRVVVTGSSGSF